MPTRPTLVLLHAFPLTPMIYDGVRVGLSEVADLVTPEFRGFGAAPLGDADPSLDLLADDVVRLLDERGVERAVVGGTSMGGYVTLALLRRHPERVEAALLANTKAGADAVEARDNRLRIADSVAELGTAAALAGMEPKLLGATSRAQRPELVGDVHRRLVAADPAAVAWAQRAMAARPDSFDVLESYAGPVLVVAGAEDELMPLGEAEAMAAAAPRSQLEVLAEAGHLGCLERPEAWQLLVAGWTESIGTEARRQGGDHHSRSDEV